MNDEKLIELVREYPILYDLSHAKNMDTSYKNVIWKKIATELKEDAGSCKCRWNNIRDNYRKSLKKTVTKSGTGAKKIKLYKYSEQIGFLNKFFEERNTKGNIKSQDVQEAEDTEQQTNEEFEDIEANTNDHDPDISIEPDGVDDVLTNQLSAAPTKKTSGKTATAIKSTKKRTSVPVAQPTASSKLMDYLINQKKETQSSKSNAKDDAVDGFLMGIGATLKTLPPYLLNLAKSEIFATAQQYEMQMLRQQSNLPSHSNMVNESRVYSSTSSVVSTPMTSPAEASHDAVRYQQPAKEISTVQDGPLTEYQSLATVSQQSQHSLQNYFSNFL